MAATEADIGYGIDIAKEDTPGAGTYTSVGVEITSIQPPGYSRDAIDASHSSSPNEFREYIAGMMDAGEVEIEGNFVAAASDSIVTDLLAGKAEYQITFPNGVTWTFDAFFTSYQPNAPVDDKQTFSATMKVSGRPELA
jgi:predicted secreted protein